MNYLIRPAKNWSDFLLLKRNFDLSAISCYFVERGRE